MKLLKFQQIAVLCLAAAFAQEPLTNESVIKMTKAGLSEAVVVGFIKTQPAKFNLTPDQLIALKVAGVPDKVVATMVDKNSGPGTGPMGGLFQAPIASGATTAAGNVAAGDPDDPMTPHDSGIYVHTKDRNGVYKLIILEQASYQGTKTGGILTSTLTYGIKKMKQKAVIPGQHAGIRTNEPQPIFYFYFEDKAAGLGKGGGFGGGGFGASTTSNPNQFALVKLTVTKSSRETIIGEMGAFGASSGTHEKSMVTFRAERLRPGLYKVVPNAQLEPGEYCFLASQSAMGAFGAGASGAAQIFDFAVASNQ